MLTTLLTLSLFGQTGTPATTQTGGSCAVQSTSRGDSLLNPTTGSDERFFSRPSGAPNVMLVLDTSAGLITWPTPLPTADGCSDANFENGYVATKSYEPPVGKADAIGWPSNQGDYIKSWFMIDNVYKLPGNADFGTNFNSNPTQPLGWPKVGGGILGGLVGTALACAVSTNLTGCNTCLQTKGYYRGTIDGTAGTTIAVGNALNYQGPAYTGLFSVVTHLIRDVQAVRFSIITSSKWKDEWGGGKNWSQPYYFWPSCGKAYSSGKFTDGATVSQRNSILNGISGDANFSGDNLAATLLYSAGVAFRNGSGAAPDAFPGSSSLWPSSSKFEEKGGANQKAICDGCVFSAIIFINGSTIDQTKDLDLTLPSFATTISGAAATSCNPTVLPNRCDSKSDEIAGWLNRNDFRSDYGGKQRISSYVININPGLPGTSELLRSVAKQGGGLYFTTTNNEAIKQAVLDALDDIASRGQTFATSAVTSIQTGQLQLTQLVPRMYPQRNAPWTGELYRFAQRNEFVEELDFNLDGDKSDVFVVDKDNDVIVESEEGFFKKAVSYTNLDAGITDANPYWEVSQRIKTMGWDNRRIWTVVDRADGRASFTHQDGMVEFKKANWSTLIHTLGLGKATCPNGTNAGAMLDKLNLDQATAATAVGMPTPTTDAARWELCAKVVIDYVRGRDLGDEDGDGDRLETRFSVMADIFHSSPVVVEPPSERFLCDLGLSTQCTKTLYAESLPTTATPLDLSSTYSDPLCKDAANVAIVWNNPYDIFRARNRARDRLVVVGSNGGMLHVFNNGKVKASTKACSGVAWSADWDQGTGDEEYAFIPPDLMPKLQDMVVSGHEYFVDGDLMVRDIWADGSGSVSVDGKKQWDEYHTMVVAAEGRGGQHYFALELIWTTDTNTSGTIGNPVATGGPRPFRWIFPQPGTAESSKMGKALFTLSPKPPPIGPVLLKYSGTGKVSRDLGAGAVDTRETWVTMLAGGWAPGLNRGRGIYMVDAYWGLVNGREDNLYWKAELDATVANVSNTQLAPLGAMSGSFTAPIAMVDYGANADVRQDGFFDTAVVGDTVGQLWVARFLTPGEVVTDTATSGTNESLGSLGSSVPYLARSGGAGIVRNWSMARAFEQDKAAAYTGNYKDIRNVQPFFYLTSVAVDPATLAMRALVGTGNRYALLEPYSGNCRWDNPMACAKYGCDEVELDLDIERAATLPVPTELEGQQNWWKRRRMNTIGPERMETPNTESRTYCQDNAELNHERYVFNQCKQDTGGDKDYGSLNDGRFSCGSESGFGFNCRPNGSFTQKLGDLPFKIDTAYANANGKDRYFGIWVYGGTRVFDETNVGTPKPKTFDTARLTDRGGSPDVGDLVNVTATTCTALGVCTGSVGTGSLGWFYEYEAHGMKTATGSAVLASCALWSSLNPGTAVIGGTEACTSSVATSSFFQADFISGEPNCAAGFQATDGGVNARFLTRNVLTPPPEPATVVQISKSGQVRYSAQLPEPGKGAQYQVDVTAGGDVLQSVYELPVSRSTHDCRHNQGGNCVPVP